MITTKILSQYRNGSYLISLYEDGTKVREQLDEKNIVEFPESIDLKITEVCDLNCPYCHENGRKDGNHADVWNIDKMTDYLSPGVEIAVGGGNPFEHHQLKNILIMLKNKGLISNITVNEMHLISSLKVTLLKEWQKCELIHGIGISYQGGFDSEFLYEKLKNIVWHCILGECSPFDVLHLERPCKVLLLGDKRYGRGEKYFAKDQSKLDYWKYHLGMILSRKDLSVSFDNLAIEQLELEKRLPKDVWNRYYMGDDGQFSMYIDAVKMQYAKNSISERKNIGNLNVREMFQDVRRKV